MQKELLEARVVVGRAITASMEYDRNVKDLESEIRNQQLGLKLAREGVKLPDFKINRIA